MKFSWWSDYRAPSAQSDGSGHFTWHEISPGTTGIVLCTYDDGMCVVLFNGVDNLLKVPTTMLQSVS